MNNNKDFIPTGEHLGLNSLARAANVINSPQKVLENMDIENKINNLKTGSSDDLFSKVTTTNSNNNNMKAGSTDYDSENSAINNDSNYKNTVLTTTTGKRVKRLACVECRQQKSKCDAYEKQPNPCTRCVKRNLPCTLKPDYKRTYKRARIAQIEKEFSDLRRTLQEAGAQGLLQNLERNSSLLGASSISDAEVKFHHQQRQSNPYATQSHFQSQSQPQSQPQYQSHLPPLRSALADNHNNNSYSTPRFDSPAPLTNTLPTGAPSPYTSMKSTPGSSSVFAQETTSNKPSIARSGIDNNINNLFGNKIPEPRSMERNVFLTENQLKCTNKQLGDVSLSPEDIKILFKEFCENYHPILPVVDISKGPERIYRLCPVLFWTIMFISLRRCKLTKDTSVTQTPDMSAQTNVNANAHSSSSRNDLYMKLSSLLKSLLAEIAISPITRYVPSEVDEPILNVSSVFSVQALLLYTFWPPLTSSLSADTSWHTIGIALFQAIRIGLHSPGQTDSFNNLKKNNLELLNEHIRTWVGCNIVSQTVATAFGFPAFVQFDAAVLAACRPGSQIRIPAVMTQMMEIQHLEDQVAKTLNNNPMDPLGLIDATERLPLLQILLEQLDELEIRLSTDLTSPLDDLRRFSLLSTRLHILTYHFLDTSKVASFELRRGFVRVYNAALALIAHSQNSQIRDKKFVRYLPGVYILTIWQAACIIARLINSPYSDVLDVGAGKELYQHAIKLALKASVLKHDMAYRSSGIMRNMWALFRILNEKGNVQNVSVTIRTRMCASIFFDCLWVLREQCGMIKLSPTQNSNENNNINSKNNNNNNNNNNDIAVVNDKDDDFNENAIDEDEDDDDEDSESSYSESHHENEGNNRTPQSSTSSSSFKRKQRTLSSTLNPESSARKIIRTIPLDPRPISINNTEEYNDDRANSVTSSFLQKVINPNNLSPSLGSSVSPKNQVVSRQASDASKLESSRKSSEDVNKITNAQIQDNNNVDKVVEMKTNITNSNNSDNNGKTAKLTETENKNIQSNQVPTDDAALIENSAAVSNKKRTSFNKKERENTNRDKNNDIVVADTLNLDERINNSTESQPFKAENVENDSPLNGFDFDADNWDSDVLWKDIDSVMNQFGFHR
ncbi:hypothetical protein PACTADRAFT_36162 [Pachysolen tannophilus NRRL Y-2460]|uniref:Zn(2)-C6 fungal-type domain-containing protein n=1 Tax=Pachysolen tannophilus NRRL Y-2460 TaxID=669874 RepID=A0A1E4TPB4_PACTA|nr:hypothetical protein PACTADRAFT_36162 [Pachysolen tannophilus NRRL Y-2460]